MAQTSPNHHDIGNTILKRCYIMAATLCEKLLRHGTTLCYVTLDEVADEDDDVVGYSTSPEPTSSASASGQRGQHSPTSATALAHSRGSHVCV